MHYFLLLGGFILLLIALLFLWKPIDATKIRAEFADQQTIDNLDEPLIDPNLPLIEQINNEKTVRGGSPLSAQPRYYSFLLQNQKAIDKNNKPHSFYKMVLQPPRNYQNNIRNNEDNYIDYSDIDTLEEASENDQTIDYFIAQGDTLNKILVNQYGIKYADVALLIQANKQLSNLKTGQKISFKTDDENRLVYFEVNLNKNKQLIYERKENFFIETIREVEGIWKDVTVQGEIKSNFAKDGQQSGLTAKEVAEIQKILQTQINFNKIQPKDQFSVVLSREMIDDEIKQSEIKAVKFNSKQKSTYAFLAEDGQYYDENANGLMLAFRDSPVDGNVRISSKFNPRRLHPVTGKVAAHNGIDFAVSTGTPVYAVADGEVTVAQYSSSAGNYITIKHNSQYITRYLHNSKMLVKPGETVKKGQKIALSGNTGRSTGPHLHYEIHINGKPVNPLTISLPKTIGLTGKEKSVFLESIKSYQSELNTKSG